MADAFKLIIRQSDEPKTRNSGYVEVTKHSDVFHKSYETLEPIRIIKKAIEPRPDPWPKVVKRDPEDDLRTKANHSSIRYYLDHQPFFLRREAKSKPVPKVTRYVMTHRHESTEVVPCRYFVDTSLSGNLENEYTVADKEGENIKMIRRNLRQIHRSRPEMRALSHHSLEPYSQKDLKRLKHTH